MSWHPASGGCCWNPHPHAQDGSTSPKTLLPSTTVRGTRNPCPSHSCAFFTFQCPFFGTTGSTPALLCPPPLGALINEQRASGQRGHRWRGVARGLVCAQLPAVHGPHPDKEGAHTGTVLTQEGPPCLVFAARPVQQQQPPCGVGGGPGGCALIPKGRSRSRVSTCCGILGVGARLPAKP